MSIKAGWRSAEGRHLAALDEHARSSRAKLAAELAAQLWRRQNGEHEPLAPRLPLLHTLNDRRTPPAADNAPLVSYAAGRRTEAPDHSALVLRRTFHTSGRTTGETYRMWGAVINKP